MKRVSDNWYMGTADAVYQNIYSIGSEEPRHVLILSGDHIYKMNYARMLEQHQESGADVTLGTILIDPGRIDRVRVVDVDRQRRSRRFRREAEDDQAALALQSGKSFRLDGHVSIQHRVLLPVLLKDAEDPDSKHDFGHDILPKLLGDYKVHGLQLHRREQEGSACTGVTWNARGILRSQHGLARRYSGLQLYDNVVAYSHSPAAVSARKVRVRRAGAHRMAVDSDRCEGCVISGGAVQELRHLPGCARELLLRMWTPASSSATSILAATAECAMPSSTATCNYRKAA